MTTSNLGRIAVVSQGDWVAGTYKALDIVRYNGAAYIAKVGTSTVPTNTSYWSLLVNDGTPNYTWIKYADDINGTGLSDSPTGKVAIGIAVNKTTATESTTASDYAWSQIRGDTGLTGSSLYTWIKYADDAIGTGLSNTSTGKLYIGIAVNKTSATESTTASDYEWTAIKGDTGTTLYTWIKYGDDTIGTGLSDSPTGKTYIGIAVNKTSATESTTASDYAWSLLGSSGGGSGTVTTVSVVSANGFAGTVATDTTTPAITLTTSISGMLKGSASALVAATTGTDYSAGTSALATGILKSTTSTGALSIAVAADFPTLNQNTTGTAANLTAATTLPSGITLVAPLLGTPASGTLTNCTGYTYANLGGTVPTWNQNTTGTAANVTGIVAVANGGTGTATPALVAGSNVTITGTWPNQTIAASGGGGGATVLQVLNHALTVINVALANGFLPVLNHAGTTINVGVS
jgi:hypothetical protein